MAEKPKKPSPDFPLTPHGSGKWCKKIKGAVRYFGRWDDPDGALAEYRAFLDAPAPLDGVQQSKAPTVKNCANAFLAAQESRVAAGEITHRTWIEYKRTLQRIVDAWTAEKHIADVGPADFLEFKEVMAAKWNLIGVGNEITRVRTWFKWLHEHDLIAQKPRFPREFSRPAAKAVRKHRRLSGKKLYTAAEILAIHEEAGTQLQAMILLGINCGLGNTDVAEMRLADLDLLTGILDYPRPKTEMPRRAILWPETIAAVQRAEDCVSRCAPAGRQAMFHRRDGSPWVDHIAKDFASARWRAGIARGGFYWLRHTFRTVADESGDQVAVNHIMGHVDASMAAVYREEISIARLRAVADYVRAWLYS